MSTRWYYAHDDNKIGPFSDQQLRDLADDRKILPTDTVWKEGIERGVAASKVKNLFPLTKGDAVPTESLPETQEGPPPTSPANSPSSETLTPASDEDTEPTTPEKTPERSHQPPFHQTPVRGARAIAGNGVIIVGQDGNNVRIKKKCVVCGFVDSCYHTMRITFGVNKTSFFCQKCRKTRQVEFRGSRS